MPSTTFFVTRRAFVAGMLATSLTPYASAFAQDKAKPVSGGTLTFVSWPGPTYLNAAISTSGPETLISGKLFDGLLDYDKGMIPVPQLATAWETSADGLKMTFKLRPGVLWHDGKPFTSKDVAFSLMKVWKELHGRGRSTFAPVTAVETPDDLTAILILNKPSPVIMKALNSAESPVLPAHLYEGTDIMQSPYNTKPVGTGPFRMVSYARGESLVLEKFPEYWNKDKPYLDSLVIRYVADGSTRAAMLESGEVNIVASSLIPPLETIRFKGMDEFEVRDDGYEISCSLHLMDFNLDNPILAKVEVRKAIAHCIDTKWITDNVWYGFGVPATGPIHHQQTEYYTTDGVPAYATDLKAAEKLLDDAGYPRKDGGIRFELTMDPSPYGEEPMRASEYMREQLRQVGITLTLRTQDYGSWITRVYTDRKFDLCTYTGSAGADPTIGVQRFYWSKNFKKGVAFSNGSHYSNPEVDALLEATQIEIDPVKRKEEFKRFQQIIMTDIPTLPLVSTTRVTIANKQVHDHTVGAIGVFGNMARTWLAS